MRQLVFAELLAKWMCFAEDFCKRVSQCFSMGVTLAKLRSFASAVALGRHFNE
jgi:hypothetical protein